MSQELGYFLLSQISEKLNRLEKFHKIKDPTQFLDFDLGVERLITLLVEIANDLLCHLLAQNHQSIPDTYYEVFGKAGELGWLPQDLAERLQQAAKMRNILIHAYGRIDPQTVRQSIPEAFKDFSDFIKRIKPLIDQLPSA